MAPRRSAPSSLNQWWRFIEQEPRGPAAGVFRAVEAGRLSRLYFPLVNDGGALSWTSPHLHGGPAAGHHQYLAPPLTAEDLPHALAHRDCWVTEAGREPFSLSGLSPSGLASRACASGAQPAVVEAGPGWFTLTRRDPRRRFTVTGTLWCPADVREPLECFQVEIVNTSPRPLTITLYAAIPLFARSADNVRDHRHVTVLLHRTAVVRHGVVVHPTMTFDERGHKLNPIRYAVLAFGPDGSIPRGIWTHEADFLGEGGSFAAPRAVWNREAHPPKPAPSTQGQEAIGGFRFAQHQLAQGASTRYLVVSGITGDPRRIARWQQWAERPARWTGSLSRTQRAWQERAHRVSFATADRTLDHWLTWVNLQPVLRRVYGNSYLPQFDYGRGGRGWRDLWQDSLALLLTEPAATRSMLLHNFGGIRIDGSNATIIGRDGTFVADRNNIPRTWMDHGAWPVFTTLLYLDQTGDADILFAERPYFRDPQLFRCRRRDPRWTEAYGRRLRTRGGRVDRGTVLEHLLVQTLTAFFNVGEHNVCRLEGADWNDGLDMADRRGESVAFSAFYAWNLARLAAVLERLSARGVRDVALAEELLMLLDRLPGRPRVDYRSAAAKRRLLERHLARVARDVSGRRLRVPVMDLAGDLRAKSRDLAERIRTQEWVRAGTLSFFNGYYDNAGRRVEGARGDRVRMTLTGQVFPVMSGMATDGQVDEVIRAVNRLLRNPDSGGVRLNTDFGAPQMNLGRAFSFAYGEKENGAVFSHMAVMYAAALYARRRAREGRRVWHALYRLATNQRDAKIFPCLPEYFNRDGRGMYGYLTGSASWLIYLLLTQAYGIRGEWGDLVLDPQLTLDDFGGTTELSARTQFAQRPLRITIANPRRLDAGRYRVSHVRCGTAALPCAARPEGGVRIPRRTLEELPRHVPALLRVTLAPLP
jgi:cellobiose phosphorylase